MGFKIKKRKNGPALGLSFVMPDSGITDQPFLKKMNGLCLFTNQEPANIDQRPAKTTEGSQVAKAG